MVAFKTEIDEKIRIAKWRHLFLWVTSMAKDEIKLHSFLWYWMTLCPPIMYAA